MARLKDPAEGPMQKDQQKVAFQFILLMGVVSLFGDITYEGVRSISGPFLSGLGASAAVVGLVAGVGEFIGYALRLASGYFSDRTKAYWPVTILGYGLLCAIPLLAFAEYWQVAALLIILERISWCCGLFVSSFELAFFIRLLVLAVKTKYGLFVS